MKGSSHLHRSEEGDSTTLMYSKQLVWESACSIDYNLDSMHILDVTVIKYIHIHH